MAGILESGIMALEGEFVIKDKGQLKTYTKVADIPDEFDHLIKFNPKHPPSPHTLEDHTNMIRYPEYLITLMQRERK